MTNLTWDSRGIVKIRSQSIGKGGYKSRVHSITRQTRLAFVTGSLVFFILPSLTSATAIFLVLMLFTLNKFTVEAVSAHISNLLLCAYASLGRRLGYDSNLA